MIDTHVNSDWAKTFVLTIINSKSVSKTTFTRVEFVETDKKFIRIRLLRLDVNWRSSNKKELIWIKKLIRTKKWIKFYPTKFYPDKFKEKVL